MSSGAEERAAPKKRRVPRKITPRYLENAALFHLRRYATSTRQLKRVLLRKADRSLRHHGGDRDQVVSWVDALVEKLVRNNLLNDAAFARQKAHSLRSGGKSARAIAFKLREKGLEAQHVENALEEATSEVSEEQAALRFARRKRLGPYRPQALRKDFRQKDLAALARAGFSYATAKRVVDADADEQGVRG